ncbi:MAG: hypothetical protein OXB98_20030 [Bryobacterales bacterium]|nr:hypothetical protein [Bryobacterales bacterium]
MAYSPSPGASGAADAPPPWKFDYSPTRSGASGLPLCRYVFCLFVRGSDGEDPRWSNSNFTTTKCGPSRSGVLEQCSFRLQSLKCGQREQDSCNPGRAWGEAWAASEIPTKLESL